MMSRYNSVSREGAFMSLTAITHFRRQMFRSPSAFRRPPTTRHRGAVSVLTRGDDGDRTHDLRLAKPALYQLSYVPGGFILPSEAILADAAERPARADDRCATVDVRRQPSATVSLRRGSRALRHGRTS